MRENFKSQRLELQWKNKIDIPENRCSVNFLVYFAVFRHFFPCNILTKNNFEEWPPKNINYIQSVTRNPFMACYWPEHSFYPNILLRLYINQKKKEKKTHTHTQVHNCKIDTFLALSKSKIDTINKHDITPVYTVKKKKKKQNYVFR